MGPPFPVMCSGDRMTVPAPALSVNFNRKWRAERNSSGWYA
jgi:hypothetical protein